MALLVPPEPPFSVLEVGVGLELEDAEAAALGTLRIVCLDTIAVVCAAPGDADVLLAAEGVEENEEDVEEIVENVEDAEDEVEVLIAAEDESDVRGVWAENDPSVST